MTQNKEAIKKAYEEFETDSFQDEEEKGGIKLSYSRALWARNNYYSDNPNVSLIVGNLVKDKNSGLGVLLVAPFTFSNFFNEDDKVISNFAVLGHWSTKIGGKDSKNSLSVNLGPVINLPSNQNQSRENTIRGYRFVGNLSHGNFLIRPILNLDDKLNFSNFSLHGKYDFIKSGNKKLGFTVGSTIVTTSPQPFSQRLSTGLQASF